MATRVSIINFKGGVGKTVLALHLATGLARYHDKKVLLVDVDHQSSLSLVCLNAKDWNEAVDDGRTINSIFKHFTESNYPIPKKEIIFKNPFHRYYRDEYPNLDLLPASLQLDETELELTSTTVGDPISSEWNKRTLLCKWIEENNIDSDYDYIVFDCPPATKLVTQNAIAASHGYVIPTIPEAVSIRGIPHLIERVFTKIDQKFAGLSQYLKAKGDKINTSYIPNTEFIGIVISKIIYRGRASYSGYTSDHTRHLRTIQKLYPKHVIEPFVFQGVGVPECLARGYPVFEYPDQQNVKTGDFIDIFQKIVNELKTRMDLI
ncbi:MAG: ParA family protein [Calditrichia bacterium]|jgi:chromosome partitioning protein|nr:ParA family protein [Calditrichia bacterium]